MISPRTVCFVYFALLFGTAHAESTNSSYTNLSVTSVSEIKATNKSTTNDKNSSVTSVSEIKSTFKSTTNDKNSSVPSVSEINDTTKSTTNDKNGIMSTAKNNGETSKLNNAVKTPVCTQPTRESEIGHCIFFLPTGHLHLIVAALTVGCLALLLTTLICACQVCHLRGIISSLQPRCDNIDRHARREKSESPCRDGGQVDGHPTETCFMLSEVTTAQDESREDEEKNDTEQPSTESPVKDPNGDITQENSPEPDVKSPESSDTGV